MKKEDAECCFEKTIVKNHHCGGGSGAIYGLGVVGALFYFLQGATTFVSIVMGIGKAFFWPALLMFKLLSYLQM
ncbi:MAG TPA: hypothetical protein VLH94_01220 [Spirochaetia bacterium]|nr:hypothetical protein [Spirochaetia bacterium]